MNDFKYILMCGGIYKKWETPRHLTKIGNETIVERTIRQLRENGIEGIAISTNNPAFESLGVPILKHQNDYITYGYNNVIGGWYECFYPTIHPACYIFGDVLFSDDAIKTIVETDTEDIEFFASAPPFHPDYYQKWAEPFALKVKNQAHLRSAIAKTEEYESLNLFARHPLMWELWQVIKHTPLNVIDYTNYTVINDWTCDIDHPEDVKKMERFVK